MALISSQTKRIPVAIVGLENAGKTSLVIRLQTGIFKKTHTPTKGLDVESAEIKGNLFQLFDLGGHRKFREMFWQTYIQLSQGIIFVIDSNANDRMEEAVEWFWKCLKWNNRVPLLILSNKSDIKSHFQLEDLIDKLNLSDLPKQNPTRSFQIFEVSIKTGQNLEEALDWFSKKVSQDISTKKVKILGVYLYLPTGLLITSYEVFKNARHNELDVDMIPGFLLAIDQFASGILGPYNTLQNISTETQEILLVKREGVLCAFVTDKNSDQITTRVIAESFLSYVEANFSEKISLFLTNGKLRFPKNFIIDFLRNEFSETVLLET